MAFITGTGPTTGLSDWIAATRDRLRAARHTRAVYRQTLGELTQLSDRDLADLGLHRSQIAAVAREAADMATA
jgi:uncharacterized protein YjiS (DUF1127 family)